MSVSSLLMSFALFGSRKAKGRLIFVLCRVTAVCDPHTLHRTARTRGHTRSRASRVPFVTGLCTLFWLIKFPDTALTGTAHPQQSKSLSTTRRSPGARAEDTLTQYTPDNGPLIPYSSWHHLVARYVAMVWAWNPKHKACMHISVVVIRSVALEAGMLHWHTSIGPGSYHRARHVRPATPSCVT